MFQRIGRFVVRRARLVLVVGLLALIGGGVLGAGAFGKLQSGGFEDPAAESFQAREHLADTFGGEPNLVLLVTARSGTVDDPPAAAAGAALTRDLGADPDVSAVVSYWGTGAPSLRSDSGQSALLLVSTTEKAADELIDRYRRDGPEVSVRAGGALGTFGDVRTQLTADLSLAESIAIPLTLALLVLAFGNVVAALLTLTIGVVAIVGTFAELSVLASLTDASVYAVNLTVGLGLGLAVDYGLLLVSRYREEKRAGSQHEAAVERAVATAGRTIAFSAATVATALAALMVFPLYFLRSSAFAGVGVVIIAAVGAIVMLPAMLVVLGPRRVEALKVPGMRQPRTEAPMWRTLAGLVTRRPLLTALPVLALLLVAALPVLDVRFGTPDDRVLRTTSESRQVGDVLRADFASSGSAAIDVVTTGPVGEAPLADYAGALSRLPGVDRVDASAGTFAKGEPVGVTPASAALGRPQAQRLSVVTELDAKSDAARDLVHAVRQVAPPAGATVLVGGQTAVLVDTQQAIADRLPLAAALIAVTTFVLLFLFTGSVVQPLRALVLNVVSLSATLGAVVFIFQQGHLSGLLGFTPVALDTGMIVLLFCIAFGLSMDYEVFVLSRIKELHDAGASTNDAVVGGLARSGRIVTTAAALIAVSFFAFLVSEVTLIQMFGLGAGLAILVDATLVRGVLVPASIRLLGRHAWWAPGPLRRWHARFGLTEAPAPEPVQDTTDPAGRISVGATR